MDHDTAGVNFVCTFLPEVRITYCGNHTAKAFHNDLTKPKSVKCKVIHYRDCIVSRVYTHSVHHHVRHGSDDFIKQVKKSLSQIMASPDVIETEDPLQAFSEALLNFHSHYCKDLHSSKWCKYHPQVNS